MAELHHGRRESGSHADLIPGTAAESDVIPLQRHFAGLALGVAYKQSGIHGRRLGITRNR